MNKRIRDIIEKSFSLKENILIQSSLIQKISEEIADACNKKNKILICGNGGSAADSQHFAAELVGRFMKNRKALPAIALTTDTSILTSIANDFKFEKVFARQVEALGNMGDILIGISTSGNSENVINAVKEAKIKGMKTICLLGCKGGALKDISDKSVIVDSAETPRIQEMHILIIHIICQLMEDQIVGK